MNEQTEAIAEPATQPTPEPTPLPQVKETKNERIEALKKKQAQIQAQIQALQQKENIQKRKEETHLKILIGAAVMADIEKNMESSVESGDKQKKAIRELLNRAIQIKKDRDFLTARGWL